MTMRLIDVNALGIGPANPDAFQEKSYANGWNAVVKMIDNAPTVDAVPVRHGKWKLIGANKQGRGGIWECTGRDGCGKSYPYQCDYCPNCGAIMDAEG